ncbi:Hsp20/alpha crystallin family protein [bacterium]|nr:Hsp20/alpha crystallin family protein [bacterium]
MFRDLMTLQDRMSRLFEQNLPKAKYEDEGLFGGSWAPAVDIHETDQAIVLKADLPGLNPNEVDIRVEDNTLYLKGERKMEKETSEENYHRIERSYGSFSRTFILPRTVSAEKISADYKNGVLNITMLKKEESKPKQIHINVNS